MEPFKITCVSCRAVLTVRKESMIGQIIACPRCSMMVQVIPPADLASTAKPAASASPSGDSATKPSEAKKAKVAASAAVAASLFESEDAIADVAPPSAPPAPVHAEPAFAATFDDAIDSLHDPIAPAAKSAPAQASAVTPAAAAPTPPPPPAGLPGEVSRWAALKFPAMVAGGAVAGAALVATALVLLSGDDSAPIVANIPPSAPAPAATDQNSASASVDPVAPPTNPVAPPTATPPSAPSDANVAAADAGSGNIEPAADNPLAEAPVAPAAAPDPFPAEPKFDENETLPGDNDAEKIADAPAEEAADNADEKEPAGDKETAAADAPKLRIDPLEIDPEGLNLSTLYNGPPKDPIAASQLPEEESAELSIPEAQQPPPEAEAPGGPPPAIGAVRRDEQAAGAPGAATAPLLARKTPELKITQLPLCRLLDLSVQLSGVPISVAPEQLRLAAVSAGQPATADVKNATIEEFLTAATKALRLKPVVVNDQIVLIRGTNNPRSERTFPIDDLANDEAAVERLVALIEQMVAPGEWQAAGGEATIAVDGKQLKINAAEAVQYDVLLLLERSRAALGKPLRSKYPAGLIDAEAAPVALGDRLSAPATFTFSQYTPLREIFRHWQEEMPVAVLVDWPALADLRLWPNTRVACSSTDKPWHAAFDAVLEPLGLAWRPIDKLTIEITSLEKANSAPLLEIYRLNPEALATIDNLIGELNQVAAASGAPAGGGMATSLIDAHGLLVARQPATVQRAFADYLAGKGLLATE